MYYMTQTARCVSCKSMYMSAGRGATLMFDESLGVIDFCPSNNIAIVYITEAELVASSAYRCRLVRLRKVTAASHHGLSLPCITRPHHLYTVHCLYYTDIT